MCVSKKEGNIPPMSGLPFRYNPPHFNQPIAAATAPANMSTQRFCLRWNNHQSNLLSVFDQLLHDESFVDVTLAVEGQLLKAHKMVLSACSPYFQALFVNHPDKHPIVILKDVPYNDMKSLLDFMYRGEVSVDQDRLTHFLRVAECLRIKGLTEVNEEKCDNIASSLSQQNMNASNMPHLQRIQQNKRVASTFNNMLGNYLLQPKRKRGRPRRLSGNSNGDDTDNKDSVIQGSPEMLEVKMGTEGFSGNNSDASDRPDEECNGKLAKETNGDEDPVAGSSKEQSFNNSKQSDGFQSSAEEYVEYSQENNQNHSNLPSSITVDIEILPHKQESVIISTETARSMMMEHADDETCDIKIEECCLEAEPGAGVHFLTDEDSKSDDYDRKKSELLEYLTRTDGSVVCKLCGEVLASRTHWYRHKYKFHVSGFVNPAPLFKCEICSVFFKSRKGYMGHLAARHPEPEEPENIQAVHIKEEPLDHASCNSSSFVRRKSETKTLDWEEQREKEEKLVADIINRVRRECEAQGGSAVTRRGYSRRMNSLMNINPAC